jgi:hypothetical protein
MKNTFGEEKVLKFGGRVASQSKQPGLNDPASFPSHRHACSTSTGPSAPQSRDARLPLVKSRQLMLPSDENSITVRSNPPGIPVVPAFEVENSFFICCTIIQLHFALFLEFGYRKNFRVQL